MLKLSIAQSARQQIRVNPAHIIAYYPAPDNSTANTVIDTIRETFGVMETVEEIDEMLRPKYPLPNISGGIMLMNQADKEERIIPLGRVSDMIDDAGKRLASTLREAFGSPKRMTKQEIEEGLEDSKFIVVKHTDVFDFLNMDQRALFTSLMSTITRRRHDAGRNLNNYIVINTDEPYAPDVVEIMKKAGHWG